jgi:hypothetical protein
MSTLMIQDLSRTRDLDRNAMSVVRGGTGSNVPGAASWLSGVGSPTVNINVNQSNNLQQFVNVQALNNIGVLGTNLPPIAFNVSPTLWAKNVAVV